MPAERRTRPRRLSDAERWLMLDALFRNVLFRPVDLAQVGREPGREPGRVSSHGDTRPTPPQENA